MQVHHMYILPDENYYTIDYQSKLHSRNAAPALLSYLKRYCLVLSMWTKPCIYCLHLLLYNAYAEDAVNKRAGKTGTAENESFEKSLWIWHRRVGMHFEEPDPSAFWDQSSNYFTPIAHGSNIASVFQVVQCSSFGEIEIRWLSDLAFVQSWILNRQWNSKFEFWKFADAGGQIISNFKISNTLALGLHDQLLWS